jgi:hypothetical protein
MAQQFTQFGPQVAKVAVLGGTAVFGTYWLANNCLYNGMFEIITLGTLLS